MLFAPGKGLIRYMPLSWLNNLPLSACNLNSTNSLGFPKKVLVIFGWVSNLQLPTSYV
jgi:hypothetical protein